MTESFGSALEDSTWDDTRVSFGHMYTFSKLFLQPKIIRSGLVCFISQKPKHQINTLERLFGLIELTLPSSFQVFKNFCQKTVDIIAQTIEIEYYQSSHSTSSRIFTPTSLKAPALGPNIEFSFENALQKTNQRLQMELYRGAPKDWAKNLNLIVGVVKDKQIFFTQLGSCQVFLIRKSKIINVLEKTSAAPPTNIPPYKGGRGGILRGEHPPTPLNRGEYNPLTLPQQTRDKLSAKGEEINPLKIFSHITFGQLENNDILLFFTENLLDYFSLEKLKKTLLTYPPQKATRILEEKLREDIKLSPSSTQIKLAAIILKISLLKSIAAEVKTKQLDSMKELVEKEKKTTKLLYPVFLINLFKLTMDNLKRICGKISNFKFLISKLFLISKFFKQLDIFNQDQIGARFARALSSFGPHLLTKVWGRIGVMRLSQSHTFRRKVWSESVFLNTFRYDKIFKWDFKTFKSLPPLSKTILISALILGLLFVQTIFFLAKQQEKKLAQKFYQEDIAQIENLWQAVETSLIYNHREKAKRLLKKAEELINELPQKTKTQKEKFIALEKENRDKLNRFWNFNIIEEPSLENAFPEDLENQKNMVLYSRWLYILDPEKNQIFKYTSKIANPILPKDITQLDNFTNKQSWLKDSSVNLQNAISMAVDGAIWILQSKHELWSARHSEPSTFSESAGEAESSLVIKLYTGYKQNFSLEDIEPKLEGPTKIYTHSDLNSLYILDPPSKRILIFDKNGKLQNQYFSEKFDDLQDFVVDKDSKKIYLLNENLVYSVPYSLEP